MVRYPTSVVRRLSHSFLTHWSAWPPSTYQENMAWPSRKLYSEMAECSMTTVSPRPTQAGQRRYLVTHTPTRAIAGWVNGVVEAERSSPRSCPLASWGRNFYLPIAITFASFHFSGLPYIASAGIGYGASPEHHHLRFTQLSG